MSEAEFYARLERLKIQQQELMDLVVGINPTEAGNQAILINGRGEEEEEDDVDEGDKIIHDECNSITSKGNRPTSSSLSKTKKSVRISSGTTYRTEFSEYADEDGLNVRPNSRSKSASPSRTRSLTVPRPFKMTQRWVCWLIKCVELISSLFSSIVQWPQGGRRKDDRRFGDIQKIYVQDRDRLWWDSTTGDESKTESETIQSQPGPTDLENTPVRAH